MKNILILGGTGFIGSNVMDRFLKEDCSLSLLTLNINKAKKNYKSSKNIKIIEGEIFNTSIIEKIIKDNKIDTILHLVSNLIPSSKSINFQLELENVIIPTFKIIDLICKEKIKFIFFSSGGTIYGRSNLKLIEDHPLNPINYYGYSKLMIEDYIKLKNRTCNLTYLIIRPSNVFGKYQRVKSQQGFIAVATHKILNKELLEIWGDGNAKRDFIDVYDLTEVLFLLLKNNVTNEIINVGSGIGMRLIDLVKIIEDKLNLKANVVFKNKRVVDLDEMVLCVDKLERYITFSPRSIDQSISLFIESIKK